MISGKEARKAWGNGEDVEYNIHTDWHKLGGSTPLAIFDRVDVVFRLKPRAITINAPKHTAQHISGRRVEIVFKSHHDASVFFNEMHEVMCNDH